MKEKRKKAPDKMKIYGQKFALKASDDKEGFLGFVGEA